MIPAGGDTTATVCGSPDSGSWYGDRGAKWIVGNYGNTIYNHSLPPSALEWDCLNTQQRKARLAARSADPAASTLLMCDGSVHFTADSIAHAGFGEHSGLVPAGRSLSTGDLLLAGRRAGLSGSLSSSRRLGFCERFEPDALFSGPGPRASVRPRKAEKRGTLHGHGDRAQSGSQVTSLQAKLGIFALHVQGEWNCRYRNIAISRLVRHRAGDR